MNSENPEPAPQAVRFQDAQAMYNQGQLETKERKVGRTSKKGTLGASLLPSTTTRYSITNRKPRGESTHNFASLSYASLCGLINCQILDGVVPRGLASWRSTTYRRRLCKYIFSGVVSDTKIPETPLNISNHNDFLKALFLVRFEGISPDSGRFEGTYFQE